MHHHLRIKKQKTKNDVNVLYSRSDPRGKTRPDASPNPKTRNITEIIQMLHEDMSDTEDNGLIRDTPKMAREGMMNFRRPTTTMTFFGKPSTTDNEAYNYSQRAMMNDETARLKARPRWPNAPTKL